MASPGEPTKLRLLIGAVRRWEPSKGSLMGGIRRIRRLRHPERTLANALDQLRAGVPLNWTQLEDDPELAILSTLQSAAWECRAYDRIHVPPEFRVSLLEQLSAQLPEPKPEPVKEAPKALAGFSEKVQVLTQAEEDVPPLTGLNFSRIGLVAAFALVLAVLLIGWASGAITGGYQTSAKFAWIELRQNNKLIAAVERPANQTPQQCTALGQADSLEKRRFISMPDGEQIRLASDPHIQFLPHQLEITSTYTLNFVDGAVSPCADNIPSATDTGAIVKLNYSLRRQISRTTGASNSPLTVFQTMQQPVIANVSAGSWEEVQIAGAHGIYCRGGPYKDVEGIDWIGDVSLLVVERDGWVITLIGRNDQGATKDLLLRLVEQMVRQP